MTERSGIVVRGFALFALLLLTLCFTSSADAADHRHHASYQQAAHEHHGQGTAHQEHQPQTPVFCAMRMDQGEGHCENCQNTTLLAATSSRPYALLSTWTIDLDLDQDNIPAWIAPSDLLPETRRRSDRPPREMSSRGGRDTLRISKRLRI